MSTSVLLVAESSAVSANIAVFRSRSRGALSSPMVISWKGYDEQLNDFMATEFIDPVFARD